ncbi:PAS domain-containing protein [Azospirillum oryzae]|uniref:histidine kinase n=2 Tax=Azospirillum oryzae TaxID=286727 RepID=A0A6N1AQK0_9PROT|nr:ATP-binding protein [Azospirillum oryzae]KAA0591436.1 PAS domain-containing protein [Azospirillum oryzae]QKS52727.1 PAS domain-containing protein [Azospirillum oryzae]
MPLIPEQMPTREDWLDALLSAGGSPQALLGEDGRVLVANRAFADALGCPPDAAEGRTLAEAGLPAGTADGIERLRRQVMTTGMPAGMAAGADGPLPGLPSALALTPVADAGGRIRAVALSADATTSDALAAALAEARAETAQARADAERARTAKGKFLSAASHDLRQPFQAMHLFHHLLSGRLTDPASIELANKLEQAIIGGETLLRALLEVSALEAGLVTANPQTFPVDELLAKMLEEFGPEAEAKGLRFNVHPLDAQVTSDPVLMERLLRPIMANALRYTLKGGILLAARRRGANLRIEVWDTGVGIDPSNQTVIFEDFHQLGNPGRDRKQGLGLGLAIVRRLAQVLGHPVTVRSKPGKGSVFAVEVPLAGNDGDRSDDGSADSDPDPAVGQSASAAASSTAGTVLVIEDDAMQLEGIGLLLQGWGYAVIPARGIDEACAGLDGGVATPDLVLSDLRLSGPETGIDAIQAVRARCGRRVPGVIVTGDTDPDRLRSVDRSGFPLVHKPCDPAALRRLLSSSLKAGRGALLAGGRRPDTACNSARPR